MRPHWNKVGVPAVFNEGAKGVCGLNKSGNLWTRSQTSTSTNNANKILIIFKTRYKFHSFIYYSIMMS